jgi:hypothetical protein
LDLEEAEEVMNTRHSMTKQLCDYAGGQCVLAFTCKLDEKQRNMYRILMDEFQIKQPFGRCRRKWKDQINIFVVYLMMQLVALVVYN